MRIFSLSRALLLGLVVAGCAPAAAPISAPSSQAAQALIDAPELAPTRQLRRLSLSLRGREPTPEDYAAIQAAADGGTAAAAFDDVVESYLQSDEWRAEMFAFGQDFLAIGDYKKGTLEGGFGAAWRGGQSISLDACPVGTLHAGALGHFSTAQGDGREVIELCDDDAARTDVIEPWFAPGTSVTTIGRAGNGVRTYVNPNGTTYDCGQTYQGEVSTPDVYAADAQCGCGPNLVYCYPRGEKYFTPTDPADLNPYDSDSHPLKEGARRMFFEEPARLFAYVADNDLPLTDLVLGDYTVAPRKLMHAYVRWARMNPENAGLDDVPWWRDASEGWDTAVPTSSLHPNLLADRGYVFDPRSDDGDPAGIPSAGVLTMLGSNGWYPRERVRAARWLEIFACRNFAAPDPSIVFPAFTGDPYDSGPCMHCHQAIDPAAIYFKRIDVEEELAKHGGGYVNIGGVGGWSTRRQGAVSYESDNVPGGRVFLEPYRRWTNQYLPNSFLTPVSVERIAENEDARLLDFLVPGETLFGEEGDGTIGPLGFGKILVQSGEFDQCVARRIFERVAGRPLDVAREATLHRELTDAFVAGNRRMRDLVRHIVKRDEFRRGI